MSEPSANALSYIPRLYGLCAFAITSVLLDHFARIETIDGVRLFFLSGFLIAGILIEYRSLGGIEAANQFYLRRVLRLAPAYYAAITVTAVRNARWPLGS
jgi:peptidoglycan/LPS O-acetylase OafA/YrhL